MYNKASCTNKIHARYIKKKEGEDVKMMNFISLEAVESYTLLNKIRGIFYVFLNIKNKLNIDYLSMCVF